MLALLALGGCEVQPEEAATGVGLISPRQQLIRLSVDLRGVHPSEAELAAIEADPTLYPRFVDRYLADPRFPDRVEELFNEVYLARTGDTYFDPDEAGLGAVPPERVADSVNDEPLKLLRYVAQNDLPWTEVVTADYTVADPVLAAMWDLDYPDGGAGWQRARYTDGRPHAGVLTMTSMWQRYPSAGVNGNRHRANAVSSILLCDDYLARPVSFSRSQIDALTTGDPDDVIRTTPTCQSCHSSLDPLAAHFFGFWWEVEGDRIDQTSYRPEDEELWRDHAGRSPGYFGTPTANLQQLGEAIADDQRFVSCAVKQVFEGITQRDAVDADREELAVHEAAFQDSGLVLRELVRSVVTSETYLAGTIDDPTLAERVPTLKLVSPAQLASIIEDKTGYRWTFNGRDGLTRNDLGLVVLGGGIDSRYVTSPSNDPSVGLAFIQERLAWSAAWHVAAHDLDPDRTEDARLLAFVTIEDTPETADQAFRAQIFHLYREVTGQPLDPESELPDRLITLWKELYSVDGSARAAWAGVLAVVLRDPAIILY